MNFDKKTIFAFVLIGLILVVANTSFYQKLVDPKGYELRQQRKQQIAEQRRQQMSEPQLQEQPETSSFEQPADETVTSESGGELSSVLPYMDTGAAEKIINVETELYNATFSTIGASLLQWELKNYPGPDGEPAMLFPPNEYGTLSVGFTTREGDSMATANLPFQTGAVGPITLKNAETVTIEFTLPLGENRAIKKSFTFVNGKYDISMDVQLENLAEVIADKRFVISAPNGLASTEKSLKDDMLYAKAGFMSGGKLEKRDKPRYYSETGNIDWVAVRTKYFAFYVIPETENSSYAAISGEEFTVNPAKKERWKKFGFSMALPYLGEQSAESRFKIYLGPLEYSILNKYDYNLHAFMDFGWGFIKWFSIPILWTLKWMHNFIPNYGIVLLIFAVLIKIITYPLTLKSNISMQRMQAIQPKMKELQEKYKNDPQKLNQATMRMYKEEGVNPMGGCLPMLIQMPLLFGLFIVFRSTIELRGQGFFLWITDLSAPDTIYTFPGNFSLPLYGNTVNILPLLMGVTMFIQQKMTVTDPRQKMMVYFMPIFLTLLFNSFPSGLNMYYALFNVLSILQQKYLTPQKPAAVEEATVVKKRKR